MFSTTGWKLNLQVNAAILGEYLNGSAFCASKQKNGDEGGKDIMKKHQRQVLFSGIITAIGQLVLCSFTHV